MTDHEAKAREIMRFVTENYLTEKTRPEGEKVG